MSWIDKILPSGVSKGEGKKRSSVPEGLWKKCVKCDAVLYRPDLERNNDVCPKCDHHMRIGARRRLDIFLDEDGREEIYTDVEPVDRLKFKDKKRYRDRLAGAQKSTGEKDALIAMSGSRLSSSRSERVTHDQSTGRPASIRRSQTSAAICRLVPKLAS